MGARECRSERKERASPAGFGPSYILIALCSTLLNPPPIPLNRSSVPGTSPFSPSHSPATLLLSLPRNRFPLCVSAFAFLLEPALRTLEAEGEPLGCDRVMLKPCVEYACCNPAPEECVLLNRSFQTIATNEFARQSRAKLSDPAWSSRSVCPCQAVPKLTSPSPRVLS